MLIDKANELKLYRIRFHAGEEQDWGSKIRLIGFNHEEFCCLLGKKIFSSLKIIFSRIILSPKH